jgi:uncharacterized protein (DUF1501 family)
MMKRRHFLQLGGAAPLLGMLGGAGAAEDDYRALVCLYMRGGNDGLNSLVPTDGAYSDYAAARPALALPKDSLVALAGSSAGHRFGVNPALAPLAALYNRGRLAWLLNAGPLLQPVTARQVLEHSAAVPSFLLSHSDQSMWQQGWSGDSDPSGWAGRALELLPSALRNPASAVTMTTERTLVLGRKSAVAYLSPDESRYWGTADLAQPALAATQTLNRMAQWQFANQYKAEYARTFGRSVQESALFTQALLSAPEPKAAFDGSALGRSLRKLAMLMPVFRRQGYRRQVFLLNWGQVDTHSQQRGSAAGSQDWHLDQVGRMLAAFDQANLASGLDASVATLLLSDFGRTLRQASGGGSDHAWGNHLFVMGGPVAGGQAYGVLPTLTLGGPDDMDPGQDGRFAPTMATDQIGATLMQWMGLPTASLETVFPSLANFPQRTLNFLKA